MITNNKIDVTHLVFVVGIIILTINLAIHFVVVDLIYLLFIVACYIKFVLIRRENKKKYN